jgi:hypothetical protein
VALHLVGHERGRGEAFSAVHDAMTHGVDVADALDDGPFTALNRSEPLDDVSNGGIVVAKRGRCRGGRPALARERTNCLAANAFDLPSGEPPVSVGGERVTIRFDELELE